jgi:hypothetical protein
MCLGVFKKALLLLEYIWVKTDLFTSVPFVAAVFDCIPISSSISNDCFVLKSPL